MNDNELLKDYASNQARLAAIGQYYPHEFIACIQDDASETVYEWMKANHIPEAVKNLYQCAIMLSGLAEKAKAVTLEVNDAAQLAELVAEATNLIAQLGGEFHSASGSIKAQPPAIQTLGESG